MKLPKNEMLKNIKKCQMRHQHERRLVFTGKYSNILRDTAAIRGLQHTKIRQKQLLDDFSLKIQGKLVSLTRQQLGIERWRQHKVTSLAQQYTSWQKLCLLEFYYDFFDKNVNQRDFLYGYMVITWGYVAISRDLRSTLTRLNCYFCIKGNPTLIK